MVAFSLDPATAEQELRAVIFALTAAGWVDGEFDQAERGFVRAHITRLVEGHALASLDGDAAEAARAAAAWTPHFHRIFEDVDRQIELDRSESVAGGESPEHFVQARLKVRCFELFRRFDEDTRSQLLATVDELILADGKVHPEEAAFRNELGRLLAAPVELDIGDLETVASGVVVVRPAAVLVASEPEHPFFADLEQDHATDAPTLATQAPFDLELIGMAMRKLDAQRAAGEGALRGKKSLSEVHGDPSVLDGHVYVKSPRPGKRYELLVLGDLHGCYSCLKAALLQADFFGKVQRSYADPEGQPEMNLVLLGDYIDRGRFGFPGVLRTVLKLFLTVPERVFVIRGNHEYYIEHKGRVLAPVRPAESMMSIAETAPPELLSGYMKLFEAMPTTLALGRLLFVHAGIPRDETLSLKWKGLDSLNDPDIRFQMLWSDPSDADVVPAELQRDTARFSFGRLQLRSFLQRIGCSTVFRGHERVLEGFEEVYSEPDARLFTLFSSGGAHSADLPATSNYREVTPKALLLRHQDGVTEVTPFAIDYARYSGPEHNGFFRQA